MILIDIMTFNAAVLLSLLFWSGWFILSFVMTVVLFRWDGRKSDVLRVLIEKKNSSTWSNGDYKEADGEDCFWAALIFIFVIVVWPVPLISHLLYFIGKMLSKLIYIIINKGIKMVPHVRVAIDEEKQE